MWCLLATTRKCLTTVVGTALNLYCVIYDTDFSLMVAHIVLPWTLDAVEAWRIILADLYTIWADKEGDISDLEWVNGMKSFFDHLVSEGKMESYRITRCKMGFRSIADMPEWMIIMEFRDMAQMDSAFRRVAPLEGELEVKHKSFNQFVSGNIQHALFRDWPDQF
jgi:hypothetical protein